MKFLLALTALPSAMACVHTWGYIVHSPLTGNQMDFGAEVIDEKRVTCSNNWGLGKDGEGRFTFGCLPGYSYSVSSDGRNSRYSTPGSGGYLTWGNSVKSNSYCCVGACEDKGPKLKCTDYSWDTWQWQNSGQC